MVSMWEMQLNNPCDVSRLYTNDCKSFSVAVAAGPTCFFH